MKYQLLILSLALLAPTQASPLADALKEHNLNWLLGKWGNDNVHISYEWKLDQQAIGVKFNSAERNAEGMIVLKPGTTEALYGAVDNQGGVSQGKWVEYNHHATLKVKHTDATGTTSGMAIEHFQGAGNTMKIIIHKTDSHGEPEAEGMEVELQRE
jgi:hypothetical protein